MATVWQFLFHPTIGPINTFLALFGIAGPNWLGASSTVLYGLSIIGIWQSVGFNMVLFWPASPPSHASFTPRLKSMAPSPGSIVSGW